jgi:hypothetical protein
MLDNARAKIVFHSIKNQKNHLTKKLLESAEYCTPCI